MMEIASTVPEVLHGCAIGYVPVNVDIGIAIEAHQQEPGRNSLSVVILARLPLVTDAQRQLDYLVGLPDKAWVDVPRWEEAREATLAAIRRGIAWRAVCA